MADYEAQAGYIRKRYRQLGSGNNGAVYAEYVSAAPVTPLGHFEVSVSSTAVGLPSIPDGARRVVLQPLSADLFFTDDGTAPSGSHGLKIYQDTVFVYDTDPDSNFKMYSTGTADVRIAYYG